jgi:hypothetical protein
MTIEAEDTEMDGLRRGVTRCMKMNISLEAVCEDVWRREGRVQRSKDEHE